jgi:aminoglycoside phosphotransferase (APT) family kinase protein
VIAASARRLDGARHRLTARRELAQLRGLLPALLVGTPADGRLGDVLSAQWTRSGVAVFLLPPKADAPAAIVKATRQVGAATSLARQHAALAELHAIDALGGWRALLPRPLAQRDAGDVCVVVETALAGRPATSALGANMLARLLPAITPLHQQTSVSVIVGERQLARWVTEPLERIAALGSLSLPQRATLTALREQLAAELSGAERRTSWIHGDYWPANVLVGTDGTVTGNVDWDRAAPGELALHDVLHALLYTRKLRLRQPLGAVMAWQLREPTWTPEEQRALAAMPDDAGAVTSSTALTLYWLRHVAENLRRDPAYSRNAAWLRDNVLTVLDTLGGDA